MFGGVSASIVLGGRGLTGNRNPLAVDPSALLQAEGLKYDAGHLSKEPGADPFNAIAIAGQPKIMSMFDWFATASIQYLIAATSDGKIYRDDGSGTFATLMKSGLATERVVHMCEGGKEAAALPKKLFIFNGFNPVQVASGTSPTTTDLVTPPADWSGNNQPSFGIAHNGRIFAGGNENDGDRIYFNDPNNHEQFVGGGAGSLPVYPGVGVKLVGGISVLGRLLLFKQPRGVFWLDDSSLSVSSWRMLKLSDGVGLAGPWAVAGTEFDVLFGAPTGLLYTMSSVDTTGGVEPRPLTDADDLDVWLGERVDAGQLGNMHIVYHAAKRTAYFAMRRLGSPQNDMILGMDMKTTPVKTFYSFRDKPQSLLIRRQSDGTTKLLFGDHLGQVWVTGKTQINKANVAYVGKFQTAHTDFSFVDPKLADIRKRIKALIVYFNPQGAHSLTVDIIYDGIYSQTIIFPMGSVGGVLDAFVLGTDRLGGDLITSVRKRVKGSTFRVSSIGYNTGLDEDFHVHKLVWQFTPAARRERHR